MYYCVIHLFCQQVIRLIWRRRKSSARSMTAYCSIRQKIYYLYAIMQYTWYAWKKINSRKWREREREKLNKYMKQVIQLVEFSVSLSVSRLNRSDLHMPSCSFFCPALVSVYFPFNWKTSLESSWFNIIIYSLVWARAWKK